MRESPDHGFERFARDMAWRATGAHDFWIETHVDPGLPEVEVTYEGEAGLPEAPADDLDDVPSP